VFLDPVNQGTERVTLHGEGRGTSLNPAVRLSLTIVITPSEVPTAVGLNVTVIVQVASGARGDEETQSFAWVKSPVV
jgi:hypothetical protein